MIPLLFFQEFYLRCILYGSFLKILTRFLLANSASMSSILGWSSPSAARRSLPQSSRSDDLLAMILNMYPSFLLLPKMFSGHREWFRVSVPYVHKRLLQRPPTRQNRALLRVQAMEPDTCDSTAIYVVTTIRWCSIWPEQLPLRQKQPTDTPLECF